MSIKYILLYVIISLYLCSCTTIYDSRWKGTTYDPSRHVFAVDSVEMKKYGKAEVERRIENGWADDWIVDSLAFFGFYLEKEESIIPVIPIFYKIIYQKKNGPYNFQVSVRNNKVYKSLDSVYYVIYDSLEALRYTGGYKYDLNIEESGSYEVFKTPYSIDIKLEETDDVYGDFELFFTDNNGNKETRVIIGVKFNHKSGRYFTSDINS